MRKLVVTGASGVVGSALLEVAARHSDVSVLALSRRENPDEGRENIQWAETDYSEESLMALLQDADAVVHLAGIKGTIKELEGYDEDMRMTKALLKASAANGIRTFIYASSRLVYGDPDRIPWTEGMSPSPRSAYGLNKVRCEELCAKYSEECGLRTIIVRIAQVLSEADNMRNMVNVFRELARGKKQITVMGKSVARRQYIYSRDLAEIIWKLVGSEGSGSYIVNAGMEKAYTNLEIAEAFNAAYGNTEPVKYDDSTAETITPSIMDVSRMMDLTGMIPRDMDETLFDMAARQNIMKK